VVLTEEFLKADPPDEEEMRLMSAAVEKHLRAVDVRPGPQAELVGVGGTVAALLALAARKAKTDPRALPQARIPFDEVSSSAIHLSIKTTAEREEMGLEHGRADIIVAGAWILTAVMSRLGASALRASVHGLRHGLIIEMASGRWR
jgi:exopolyphosphatase/guanosine-5'-triphosphate,3'-diphosphate pyrophosphatase